MKAVDVDPPSAEKLDYALGVLRSVVTAIPGVGGSITELMSTFLNSPLAKRRDEWFKQLALAIVELQQSGSGLTAQELLNDERFITAVFSASSIAMRNHKAEKLAALANAVKSSVVLPMVDEDEQSMFMRYIDELTSWPIKMLRLFFDPNSHFAEMGLAEPWLFKQSNALWGRSKSSHEFVTKAFPGLETKWHFLNQLVYDLAQRGLIATSGLQDTLPDIGPYTTFAGNRFMAFICADEKKLGEQ
jgi:hypothetical protein